MRHRLLVSVRSILLGWVTLFAITFVIERPLLSWIAPLLGPSWLPTAQLALACLGLAATGWILSHGNRFDALLFAVMLAAWNFGLIPVDLPWLLRLIVDSFQSPRYLQSLLMALMTYILLFGSLFAGARFSRRVQPFMSIAPDKMDNRA